MSEYVGAYALLAVMPMWLVVLVALIIGFAVPFVIADRVSGLFFNYSYSGMIGDICLLTVILIGVTIIQRGEPLLYWYWFSSGLAQAVWLAICVAAGVMLVTVATPWPIATWPDRYHNAVTVPLLMFFLPPALLATLYGGDRVEALVACLLFALWLGLVFYDFENDRMDQPRRLEQQFGIRLFQGRFEKLPF